MINNLTVYPIRIMVIYFVIVNTIAIYLFPGGSLYDPTLTSYSFSENFFSDLGVYETVSGEQNFLSCFLFNSTLVMMGFACLSFILVPRLFKDNKVSYVCATIGSYIAMLSGLSFLGVGLTPADLYFHEHVFFVIVGFRSMVPAMVFLTLAFFFSPVSNKYTVASVLFLLSITLYAFFETSDPPDVSPRENLELFKESVSYNRMVISVIAQKVITLISFVSFFVFTYGFYQLSLLKK
jgi:hypothetical membrane protein